VEFYEAIDRVVDVDTGGLPTQLCDREREPDEECCAEAGDYPRRQPEYGGDGIENEQEWPRLPAEDLTPMRASSSLSWCA